MRFKRIRTRIIASFLPLALLTTVSLVLISYSMSIDRIKNETTLRMWALLENGTALISDALDKNANIAQALASYVSSVDRTTFDSGAMSRFMFSLIPKNKHTIGGGVWFEPYGLYEGEKYVGPYVYRKGDSHILSHMYSNEEYDYVTSIWYLNGRGSSGSAAWTDVYYDELSGITMLTAAQPFFDQKGAFLGVCSADMDIDSIKELVASITFGETGRAFLLGMRGNYLVPGNLDKPLDMVMTEDPDAMLASVGKSLMGKDSGIVKASDGEKSYLFYFRTIPSIGWKLAISLEEDEVAAPANSLLFRMLGVTFLAVVVLIVSVGFLARHFNAIIQTVNAFSRRAAAGNLEERLVLDVHDEFASIAENVNTMLENTQKLAREKGNFLSRMSHEIRTPMNAIIGMSQIAKTTEDSLRIKDCLHKIETGSKHVLALINDILDYSKVEAGKLRLDLKPFSLSADLDAVVSMLQPRAAEKDIELSLKVHALNHDEIVTDALRLNQVLINLLSNAIKFSPQNGRVDLSVTEVTHENGLSLLDFSVKDNGIGIDPALVPHLFSPFVQATGITASHGGTGLGLAISKNIVAMMGGRIDLQSAPGAGATFSFAITVPACAAKAKPVTNASKWFFTPDLSRKRILIVDDIEVNREIAAEFLRPSACRIDMAENGKEALDKFRASAPGYYDVILMDMQMPVMDGCTSVSEIRSCGHPDSQTVCIVAMTASVLPEDVHRAMNAGMDAHIGKPLVIQEIFTTIGMLLGEHVPAAAHEKGQETLCTA